MEEHAEAKRLEDLWRGEFGDQYVERNAGDYGQRGAFWHGRLRQVEPRRVLEIGSNIGGNLEWIAREVPPSGVHGIDVNSVALRGLRSRVPGVHAIEGSAKGLPFRSGSFDLVFTMGVLIHQPEASLPAVLDEMVRCTDRWVMCGEYFAEALQEVPYRGIEGALFRRDYGKLFTERFPQLRLRDTGFLERDEGWDDVTWWLFEKEPAEG